MSRKQKKYKNGNAAKLTKKQQKDILAKIAEAETAIADLEKEIAAEDLSPASIVPDEIIEPGLRLGYDAEASGKEGVVEGMFNYCPTCADEKVAKGRAADRSQKTEMILTLRKIVGDFRAEVDTRLNALSGSIEAQIKPIIAMTSSIAVTRRDMDERLQQFEDNLHRAMGLDKELDPEVVNNSLFGDALKDSVAPDRKPASAGWTTKDSTLVGSEFDDMLTSGGGDPAVAEPLETALDSDDEEQWRQ